MLIAMRLSVCASVGGAGWCEQHFCRHCRARIKRSTGDSHTVCWKCRINNKRKRPPEDDRENVDPHAAARQHLISTLQSTRKHKPFERLQPRPKRARVHNVKAFAALTDTPLSALQPTRVPPANLIHLPTSTRRSMRTVEGLRIASEKKIRECKLMLAQHSGTETLLHTFYQLIRDIWLHWEPTSGLKAFPKLHMQLVHAWEFVQRFKVQLGDVSEAQMESDYRV
jgi:hypothetical protein